MRYSPGVLNIIFRIADHRACCCSTISRVHAVTQYIGDDAEITPESVRQYQQRLPSAIRRGLLTLERRGPEPSSASRCSIKDWMRTDSNGKGVINILTPRSSTRCRSCARQPAIDLSELYEQLPEAGNLEKPKLVFFLSRSAPHS
ncbi:helicase HerA-like domain-containing protein [Shigella flexneri]